MPARSLGRSLETVPRRLLALQSTVVETAPGITSPELRAFLFVADNEGACQRDVRDFLDIPQATASRALSNLKSGNFDLIHCELKGRQHELSLSPKGRQLIARLACILGCFCAAPAANSILNHFEIGPPMSSYSHAYDACRDEHRFGCDVS